MTTVVTRYIHPLQGYESLKRHEDEFGAIGHASPPRTRYVAEGTADQQILNRGTIKEAANHMLQLRKQGIQGEAYPGNLQSAFYGLSAQGTQYVMHMKPVHPFVTATEAGAHVLAWTGDITRLTICFGARIMLPGHEMPPIPDSREWRKALHRSTGMARAILSFVFDRFEGPYLAANIVHYSPGDIAVGFSGIPESHRRCLQLEWEELMDSTDWRAGPTFHGQRMLDRLDGVNTP